MHDFLVLIINILKRRGMLLIIFAQKFKHLEK